MTITNEQISVATIVNEPQSGYGWDYDEAPITYDGATDPRSGMSVFYDGIGVTPVVTNEAISTASVTNEAITNV